MQNNPDTNTERSVAAEEFVPALTIADAADAMDMGMATNMLATDYVRRANEAFANGNHSAATANTHMAERLNRLSALCWDEYRRNRPE